jgi:peptidoglycan/LPS O-acetylase OafA/YrhL
VTVVKKNRKRKAHYPESVWKRHSLSIIAAGFLAVWFILYVLSDPDTHPGSFFGNAVADWTGLVMTVMATKWFFEKGSRESRQPDHLRRNKLLEFVHEHSLTIFFLITGMGWILFYSRVDPESKWGTVVSNLVSEWTQQIGLILLTKRLIEIGSKE